MAVDYSRMTPEQVIASLQQQYAKVQPFSPMDPYGPGWGEGGAPEFMRGEYTSGDLTGFTPNNNGGYSGPLTPNFDPSYEGGKYGQYRGTFSADGTLDPASVVFSPEERSGSFVSENMLPLTLAVMGGSMLASGAFGAGAGGAAAGSTPGYTSFIPELAGDAYLAGGLPEAFTGAAQGFGGSMADLAAYGADAAGMTAPTAVSGAGGLGGVGGAAGIAGAAGGILDGLGGVKGLVGLAGAAAGALGAGPDTATTSRNVPEWAQPYAQDITKRGQDIANTPFQPYTGQRYAGPNDAMRTSWEMANQAAQGGPSAAQQISQGTFNRLQSGAVPDFGKAAQVDNQYIGRTTAGAGNQYIGRTTAGAGNQYIGQNANSNVSALLGGQNPALGQTTGSIGPLGQMSLAQTTTDVGRNALLGQNNPYLNDAIGFATGDITRNFNNTINPQLDRMARASGSFGNSGVEQARQEAQRTMAQQIGRTTSDMRMADYNLQAQLGEGDLGRRTNASLTDAARNLGASQAQQQFNIGNDFARQQTNLGYRAGDLGRNMTGFDTAQGRMLDAGKFDANNAQQNWQTNLGATSNLNQFNASLAQGDLARNAQLQGQQQQFNASLAQGDLARNAQLQGQQQQFNANQGNFDITGARNDWNSAEGRAAQTMNAYQGYDQANTNRIAMLNTTGNEMNRFAQQPLDFQNQEFMRQQQYPAQQLGVYQGAYNTGVNGQSVQSTPTGNSPAANLLGGATSAIGLYNLFTQPQQQQQQSGARWTFDPMTGARY